MTQVAIRPKPLRWAVIVGMVVLGVSALFPLAFMLQASFRSQLDWANAKIGLPTTFSLEAFGRAWVQASIGTYFINSVIVTVGAAALSVFLATTSGFAFSVLRWRGRSLLYFFILAWIAIPPLLLMVPIYVEMVDLGLVNTYWSVILLYSALNLPFNMYLMTAFFRSVPGELLEAARVDGASAWQELRYVTLPMMLPTLVVTLVFRLVVSFKVFDEVYLLTGGGPGTATEVVSFTIFRRFFTEDREGYGAAISVVVLFVLSLVIILGFAATRRRGAAGA
jgi:ABC-type glycerol-3-phosphate transport system permease component